MEKAKTLKWAGHEGVKYFCSLQGLSVLYGYLLYIAGGVYGCVMGVQGSAAVLGVACPSREAAAPNHQGIWVETRCLQLNKADSDSV